MFNYPGTHLAPGSVLDTIFPKGVLLVIRQPTVVFSPHLQKTTIRVDSPSDIVFVRSTDKILIGVTWKSPLHACGPQFRSAEQWKKLGKEYRASGHSFAAAVAFTNGLAQDPEDHQLRADRAGAFFDLEYHSAVLADAKKLLVAGDIGEPGAFVARSYAAHAESGLCNFEAARTLFKECLATSHQFPEEKIAGWINSCDGLLLHQDGRQHWPTVFADSRNPDYAMGEWVGPIKVVPMPHRGGGRGVVTTKEVQKGDYLVSLATSMSPSLRLLIPK